MQFRNDSEPRILHCGTRRVTFPMHYYILPMTSTRCVMLERGSSAVEFRTRNQVSPRSNHPLLPIRRLGIFVLSIAAAVDSAV